MLQSYYMSMKSWPILYKIGQDFLERQYKQSNPTILYVSNENYYQDYEPFGSLIVAGSDYAS